MDSTLKNEISNLCEKIVSHPSDQPIAELIEKLEQLQEKLLIREYLMIREARFQRLTNRLEGQLQNAVEERPLQVVPPKVEEAPPVPSSNPTIAEKPTTITDKEHNTLTEAFSPSENILEEEGGKTKSGLHFEPTKEIVEEEAVSEPEKPTAPRQKMSSPQFIPNPKPTITAKRTAPADPPKDDKQPEVEMPKQDTRKSTSEPSAKQSSIGDQTTARASLNDRLNKNLNIGLNDRIGFVKHLFGGSQEDFNRVISQLNTMTNLDDATDFIRNFVKPDYNWEGKEEYEERLVEIVTKRFEN